MFGRLTRRRRRSLNRKQNRQNKSAAHLLYDLRTRALRDELNGGACRLNLELFLTVALNGLTVSALYFIVAIGFSLIFGLMRSVNMAHGTLFLVGAYAGVAVFYPLYDNGAAYAWIVALAAGISASAILGVVLQVVFLGWMQGQELRQTLVTIGISIIVADQLLAIFGGLSQQFYAPDILFGSLPVPFVQGGRYSTFRLFQVVVAIGVGLGLWLILADKTRYRCARRCR